MEEETQPREVVLCPQPHIIIFFNLTFNLHTPPLWPCRVEQWKAQTGIQAPPLPLTLPAALDGELAPLSFLSSSVKGSGPHNALSQVPEFYYGSGFKFTLYAGQGKSEIQTEVQLWDRETRAAQELPGTSHRPPGVHVNLW